MKTIVLVRHAQSGWMSATGDDFDRTLDSRGHRDAPTMARRLARHGVVPEIFLSSPALRAKSTAIYFLKEFRINESALQLMADLYEPSIADFYTAIATIPAQFQTGILFSHNPGITEFIHDLNFSAILTMPSGGMVAFHLMSDDWKDIHVAEKQFLFFESPE